MAATLTDIAIDPTTGDVYLDGDDLALVVDNDAIKQGIRISIQFFFGEWFLDKTEGVDYFGTIFKNRPELSNFRAQLVSAILASPGVTSVVSVSFRYTPANRSLAVSFEAKADKATIKDTFDFQAVTG